MIKVTHLSKKFDKRGIAGVHDLSFELNNGEVMAIMGPNGGGKSTLLNLLCKKLAPEGGEIIVDKTICLFPSSEAPQEMNVLKFLTSSVTLDIEEEKKIQLARDLADTFEFTFQLRQNLSELSSGQKQKILLARELINRPGLLLMDEPFTHLDPFTRKDILRGLFEYIRHQGITVLWVTHDLDEAFEFSDQLALMNFGKFVQIGNPEELVRNPKNLFVAQFMGYRNFFSAEFIKKSWKKEWNENELLIVPDRNWKEHPDGLSFKVEVRHPTRQGMEYRLRSEERTIYLTTGPQQNLRRISEVLTLLPEWEKCLRIPL